MAAINVVHEWIFLSFWIFFYLNVCITEKDSSFCSLSMFWQWKRSWMHANFNTLCCYYHRNSSWKLASVQIRFKKNTVNDAEKQNSSVYFQTLKQKSKTHCMLTNTFTISSRVVLCGPHNTNTAQSHWNVQANKFLIANRPSHSRSQKAISRSILHYDID